VHTFNPSTWEVVAGRFLSSRPAWSTEFQDSQDCTEKPCLEKQTNKQLQKSTFKQLEALNKEANKYKERQENPTKQVKDMNKTVQDFKREIEAIKKTQTEEILEMENLGKRTRTKDTSLINRIQEMSQ
jgi:predicted  nucleic acid-binding Zn-ribbon protein